jgi:hypothetical protein
MQIFERVFKSRGLVLVNCLFVTLKCFDSYTRGLGFGVWGLGFGVWGLGFGVWGLG